MGYMTNYYMDIVSEKPLSVLGSIEAEGDRMNVFEDGNCRLGWNAWTTWYDWEEDMILLSRKFPDVLFKLNGSGEDSEDLWEAYFLNGRVQICPGRIVYDDFNLLKLIEKSTKQTKYSYQ